ncbi:MAG: hypothetical protein H6737_29280 [Alphaproteobacteria bacterium]|nr:hypothetical protein [Alphaproteobacteria bacterium]
MAARDEPRSGAGTGAPDWERLTGEWVRDGVIEDAQREALLERLTAVDLPSPSGSLFGEAAVMGLVMAGMMLVTSSFVVALALFDTDEVVASIVVAALGGLQCLGGVAARFVVHRAVGHGTGAAGIVVLCSGLFALGLSDSAFEPFCLVAVLGAFAVASAAAVADDARGLAGAAGFAVMGPLLSQLDSSEAGLVLGLASFVYTVVVAAGSVAVERLELPARIDVLAVHAPFAAFVASVAILIHRPVFFTAGSGQEWESSLLLGAYGGAVLIAGWQSTSRFALVSGLGVLLVAQIPVLWAFGDAVIGIAVLGLEGMTLIGAAILTLVVRARREERDA